MYMAGKGQPVGGAVTVLPACSQPRSGPACWNPACSECSKHLVGFCVKCCHCCSFVPWLSSQLSPQRAPSRRPPPSLVSPWCCLGVGGALVASDGAPGPLAPPWGPLPGDSEPASRPAHVTSLFSLSPY